MFLHVLKQLKQIKEDYPELEEFVFLIAGEAIIKNDYYFFTFIFAIDSEFIGRREGNS